MLFWCTCRTWGRLLQRPQQLVFVPAFQGSNLLLWSEFAELHPSGSTVETSFSGMLLSAKVSFSTISGGNSLITYLYGRIHLGTTCQGLALISVRPWPSCKPNKVDAGSRIKHRKISGYCNRG